jgi:hypothetical protein
MEHYTLETLIALVKELPVGTNKALLHFMWMLVSGALLSHRGALHPALKSIGLEDAACRRAWGAFGYGAWTIQELQQRWRRHVSALPGWQRHAYEGYHPVAVDLVAFWRPRLQSCPSKHYYAPAGKALPAVVLGVTGDTGEIGGQRLALPRDFLRVAAEDSSEQRLVEDLLRRVKWGLKEDEMGVFDAGFKVRQMQAAGIKLYLIRLPKNFTARRNEVAPYKGYGRYPVYGEKVRPLPRTYNDNLIPGTPPDTTVCWVEDGRRIKAEVWYDLVLPDVVPDPQAQTFHVFAIHDPHFDEPWLLACPIKLKPRSTRAMYADRWPVEQIPLSAKHMVGAHRQFVFAAESIQRLPELALLAGSILSFLAATMPAMPTGFWDRHPRRTPGRLRRALQSKPFPQSYPLPGRIREKASVTDHLPKGILAHRRQPGLNLAASGS